MNKGYRTIQLTGHGNGNQFTLYILHISGILAFDMEELLSKWFNCRENVLLQLQ